MCFEHDSYCRKMSVLRLVDFMFNFSPENILMSLDTLPPPSPFPAALLSTQSL